MHLGIIDLGTNAARFSIHQVHPKRELQQLYRDRVAVPLGRDVFSIGELSAEVMEATIDAFLDFKETAKNFEVQRIVAVATSALREASNSSRLLKGLKRETGIKVKVISGEEEARLIAAGVTGHERNLPKRWALIDIGGGSTEISLCRGKNIDLSVSLELGAVRLSYGHLGAGGRKRAPRPKALSGLREEIRDTLASLPGKKKTQRVPVVFGSSGTIRSICRVSSFYEEPRPEKDLVTADALEDTVRELSVRSPKEIRADYAVDSWRSRNILAGAVLLEEIVHTLGAKKVVPTKYSLRHGILHEELKKSSRR